MLGLIKTYALQGSLIALLAVGVFAGVQTWRLGNAQDKIDEQRQLVADVKAANLVNQATIETLRKVNADWSDKCKADAGKWSSKLAEMVKQHEIDKENLKKAPAKREVIYRESKDECAGKPVPAGIAERLRG